MAANPVMRQMDERTTEQEVLLLLWSPKMDILALAFQSGEVSLYRLQWQKVWTAPPPDEEVRCTSLCWRPDGKLLASGYATGRLDIRHIEGKDPINTANVDGEVTSLAWVDKPVRAGSDADLYKNISDDKEWEFLSRLPSLSKTYSYSEVGEDDLEDCRHLIDSDCGTVLLAGTSRGTVYVFMSGYLLCMKVSLSEVVLREVQKEKKEFEVNEGETPCWRVEDIVMAGNMKTFSCVVTGEDSGSKKAMLMVINCPLLASCASELSVLADKYSLIHGTLKYMDDTIKQIIEAWEGILLEMDTKLSSYDEKNPPGTVAADFLELLMFGMPSTELQNFLMHDLTDKGLKKLGHSVELSYSNMQRLVLKYLHAVAQSINFHLGDMVGLTRASHRFSVIGVTVETVETARYQAASFWSKGVELHQVIDESMRNFKAFFKWLYVEILKLTDESVAGDLSKASQQDITYIAEFLKRFSGGKEDIGLRHVYVEKVGQYLKDGNLDQPPDTSNNPWCNFLADNPEIQEIPFILPASSNTSIVQEHAKLVKAVNAVFDGMNEDMTGQAELSCCLLLPPLDPQDIPLRCRQLSSKNCVLGLCITSKDKLLHWRLSDNQTLSASWLTAISPNDGPAITITDCSFFTDEVVSVLLEGDQQTLLQLPVAAVTPHLASLPPHNSDGASPLPSLPSSNMLELGGRACCRALDNISAEQFAVSGPRKVSVFLFKNKKRIRIYDMEVEEEEDDETLESSGFSTGTDYALQNTSA